MNVEERIQAWMETAGCRLIKPSGDNLISRCPFHDDHKRSFSMNVETGRFICFSESCGEQGGLMSFLINACDYSVKRAKKVALEFGELSALNAGVWEMLPAWNERTKKAEADAYPERFLGLYDFCPKYMLDRGFSKSTLREWEIGYDFETKRVTIPVRDAGGRVVGMTRRATKASQETKYLHLNFQKSHHLYGRNKVTPNAPVYVGEGQLDAIALYQMGVRAVSTMGARVSPEQLRLLYAVGDVVLAYDQDRDGMSATTRIGNYFLERGRNCRVATHYPNREHPDGGKWDPGDVMRYGTGEEQKRFLTRLEWFDLARLRLSLFEGHGKVRRSA